MTPRQKLTKRQKIQTFLVKAKIRRAAADANHAAELGAFIEDMEFVLTQPYVHNADIRWARGWWASNVEKTPPAGG